MQTAGVRETTTASVLFTDVVGSTELQARLGDEPAAELRRKHDDTLGDVIVEAGGRIVKTLGDGVMAVFDAAADAVAAAIAGQQGITAMGPVGDELIIRVGISVGDVTFEDGDCFGATVNEAARLCAAAQGGQILVADVIRTMARGRGGFVFESVGSLELKGLPEPVPACSVGWEPLRVAAPAPLPFPPTLMPPTAGTYVGRQDIRTAISVLWDESKRLGSRTALLVGEPGIGKTRTAYELARSAHDEGAVVLFGRCDDELRVPYQPFVEALSWQVRHSPDMGLGRLAGELARLVPDVAAAHPELVPPVKSDPRTEEHRLFEATASWLVEVARTDGLVIVLDDLHWATKPTLLMLLHVVRAAAADDVRLLLVGTYRDTDLDRAHPLSTVLADLRRLDGVHRIPVDALDRDEVMDLVEQAAGHSLDDATRALAVRAHEETEGNPFFVAEVLRHLVETGAVRFVDGRWVVPDPDRVDVPEGVRDVVGQRLSRLTDAANELLRTAAVVGREFDLDLISSLTKLDETTLLDAVDEASRARLIEELDADTFRFTHALVRTTLYEELSASRRRRMHRDVVDRLTEQRPDDLGALAHHSIEAGPRGGSLSQAIGFVIAAGHRAQDARAYGEAEAYFVKALELLDEDDSPPDPELTLSAMCGLGEAQRDQGDSRFRQTLLDASRRAIETGDEPMLIRTALANSRGFSSVIGDIDEERIEILEAALLAASKSSDEELMLIRSTLARELVFDGASLDRSAQLADDAVAAIQENTDPRMAAQVLGGVWFPRCTPPNWVGLVPEAEHMVGLADQSGDPSLRVIARQYLTQALLCVGDITGASAEAEKGRSLVSEGAGPFAEWLIRAASCQYLIYQGLLDEASEENDAVLAIGQSVGAPDAESWWGATGTAIHHCRDPGHDDADLLGAFADQFPLARSWRAGHMARLAHVGRLDECRELLDGRGYRDLDRYARDCFWLASMFNLAVAAGRLEDAELGRELTEALAPYDRAGCHYGLFMNGTVELARARAAVAQGRLDEAIVHHRAEHDWARSNSRVLTVTSQVELAEVLARRGEPNDLAEGRQLAETVAVEAQEIGMTGWESRAESVLFGLG